MTSIPTGFAPPDRPISPLTVVQPVLWGEMDALGHVNHTVYLRWMETGRFHYFATVGLTAVQRQTGVGPILAHIEVDYLAAVSFPDRVWISTRSLSLGTTSFEQEHVLHAERVGKVCARAKAVIVTYDYGLGHKVAIPEPVRAAIAALDGAAPRPASPRP